MTAFNFTEADACEFLDAMVECNSIDEALKVSGITTQRKTVYRWLRMSEREDDRFIITWLDTKEQFASHFEYTFKLRAIRLHEEADAQARNLQTDVKTMEHRDAASATQAARIFQDYVKWSTAKLDRNRYGKPNDDGAISPIQVTINIDGDPSMVRRSNVVDVHSKDVIENSNANIQPQITRDTGESVDGGKRQEN